MAAQLTIRSLSTSASSTDSTTGCLKLIGDDFTHILSVNQSNSPIVNQPICVKLGRKTGQPIDQTIGISINKNVSREHCLIAFLPFIDTESLLHNQSIKQFVNPHNAEDFEIFNEPIDQSHGPTANANKSVNQWYLIVKGKNGVLVEDQFFGSNQAVNLSVNWSNREWIKIQISETIFFAIKPITES